MILKALCIHILALVYFNLNIFRGIQMSHERTRRKKTQRALDIISLKLEYEDKVFPGAISIDSPPSGRPLVQPNTDPST